MKRHPTPTAELLRRLDAEVHEARDLAMAVRVERLLEFGSAPALTGYISNDMSDLMREFDYPWQDHQYSWCEPDCPEAHPSIRDDLGLTQYGTLPGYPHCFHGRSGEPCDEDECGLFRGPFLHNLEVGLWHIELGIPLKEEVLRDVFDAILYHLLPLFGCDPGKMTLEDIYHIRDGFPRRMPVMAETMRSAVQNFQESIQNIYVALSTRGPSDHHDPWTPSEVRTVAFFVEDEVQTWE